MTTPTWDAATPPPPSGPFGLRGWLRIVRRGSVLGVVVFGGLLLLLVLRLIERPLFGMSRPVTPWITQGVCRAAFVIMRLPITARGPQMQGPGAYVANHSTWLDIFALNSQRNVYFVAKSEVAGWPGIGWLARATGTLFIRRDRREAQAQAEMFKARLRAGHRLLFFPEGTSTDGLRVLPFKSTLFAAFFADDLRHDIQVQAISAVYHPPKGRAPRTYGWWGDMGFAPNLLQILSIPRHGRVELIYHPPVRVDDMPNRKTLAATLEDQVRNGHKTALGLHHDTATI